MQFNSDVSPEKALELMGELVDDGWIWLSLSVSKAQAQNVIGQLNSYSDFSALSASDDIVLNAAIFQNEFVVSTVFNTNSTKGIELMKAYLRYVKRHTSLKGKQILSKAHPNNKGMSSQLESLVDSFWNLKGKHSKTSTDQKKSHQSVEDGEKKNFTIFGIVMALIIIACFAFILNLSNQGSKSSSYRSYSNSYTTNEDSKETKVDLETALQSFESEYERPFEKTTSGIYIMHLQEGNGEYVNDESYVTLAYSSELLSGKIISEEVKIVIHPNGLSLVRAWDEILKTMKQGGRSISIVPAELGHSTDDVKDNEWVVYKLHVIKISDELSF